MGEQHGDFTFMRTGTAGEKDEPSRVPESMVLKLVSLVAAMVRHATHTAALYAEHAGRRAVAPGDVHRALRHEARHFFHRASLEQDVEEMEQMIVGSSSEGESDDETETESESEPEDYSPSTCQCEACVEINRAWDTWEEWHPEDEAEQFVKRAVDKTVGTVGTVGTNLL